MSNYLKYLARALTVTVASLISGVFIAWLIINWMSGCGESFHYADGTTHQGECISFMQIMNPMQEQPHGNQ